MRPSSGVCARFWHVRPAASSDTEPGHGGVPRPGCEPRGAPVLRRYAAVGAGATILPGVEIGEGALVGAGAVVTRDVAPWTIVMGVPARVREPVPDAWRRQIVERVRQIERGEQPADATPAQLDLLARR